MTYEGRLREVEWSGDGWWDMLHYAILDHEWQIGARPDRWWLTLLARHAGRCLARERATTGLAPLRREACRRRLHIRVPSQGGRAGGLGSRKVIRLLGAAYVVLLFTPSTARRRGRRQAVA